MKKCTSLLLVCVLCCALLGGCGAGQAPKTGLGNGWQKQSSLTLDYAKNFSVDFYAGGYALATLADGERFLSVPQGAEVPSGIDADIVPLCLPLDNIYLVASAVMSMYDALGALDCISLCGTSADKWYIADAKQAMEAGTIRYAGKYSQPDYELITSSGCRLAVESTMINHAPEVREKLETLGVPVLIDQSSTEENPLGRTEWIKLYGVLLGRQQQAQAAFQEQEDLLTQLGSQPDTGKTVAFFYINSNGSVVVRRSGDYISKMIEMAGGEYVFQNLGDPDSSASAVTISMEDFYAGAKDADILIYNSTIEGEVPSIAALVAKNALFADFKAVRSGDVWCTEQNLYQETMQIGRMIQNMNAAFADSPGSGLQLDFLYRLPQQ